MKIGYISPVNPFYDKKEWSGTFYNVYHALQKAGYEVEWIGYKNNTIYQNILRTLYKVYHLGKVKTAYWEKIGQLKANSIKKDLGQYDLIFVPAQSEIVACLKTETPIVYYSDATIPLMVNYYWFNFSKKVIELSEETERKALNNSAIKMFSSKWAANSAIKFYKQSMESVKVLPFGANLPNEKINSNYSYQKGKVLNILFSGVDWGRKGGKIAVETVKKLIGDGYNAKLFICGVKNLDKKIAENDFIVNLGFLDKNDPEELDKYVSVWKKTDLFLLPTRAECAGIVFSEAAAFGVPVITTDTGGISDYVKNDFNGYRLKLSDNQDVYASKIESLIDNNKLNELSTGALEMYKHKISWEAWVKKFNEIVKEL